MSARFMVREEIETMTIFEVFDFHESCNTWKEVSSDPATMVLALLATVSRFNRLITGSNRSSTTLLVQIACKIEHLLYTCLTMLIPSYRRLPHLV